MKVIDAIRLMVQNDKRVLILTDDTLFQVRGIIVCSDICSFLGGGEKCELDKTRPDCYNQIYERPISTIMTTAVRKAKDDIPLFVGVHIMTEQNIGTLPLIDKHGDLTGIITERDIAFLLADTNIEIKVRDVMTHKVVTCPLYCTIGDALRQVCSRGFRRLPIVENDELVGFITVKDLLRYFYQEDVIQQFKKNNLDIVFDEKISTIMSSPVITVEADASINELAQILRKHNIGATPVVENDKLVGIITEKDIVKAMTFPSPKR
ncbi:MAG: CBS domain-containing protein [Candidatus Helarchaeota archaeon]